MLFGVDPFWRWRSSSLFFSLNRFNIKWILPFFRLRLFPNTQATVSGFGVAPASRRRAPDNAAAGGGGHRWGRGQRLGGD